MLCGEVSSVSVKTTVHYEPTSGVFGDPIPFYWDGVYHVFYLRAPEAGGPTSWGHIASKDLVRWHEFLDALEPGAPGTADDGGCGAGSVIESEGVFHAFYTGIGVFGQTICHATSRDLVQWEKDPRNPVLLPDGRWYATTDWRDPLVIRSPEGNGYWMLIAAREKRKDEICPYNACVALACSSDLAHWEVAAVPLASAGVIYMECPDLFQIGDKWCLVMALRETTVRVAESPRGPWQKMRRDSPDTTWGMAGKTTYDGRRRILFSFLARRENNSDHGRVLWGGRMLLPREFYLDAVGEPAVRCPREVINAYKVDLLGPDGMKWFAPDDRPWKIEKDYAEVEVPNTAAVAVWQDAPANYLFSGQLTLSDAATTAGIFVRTSKDWQTVVDLGYQILFEPDRRRVSIRPSSRCDTEDIINETAFYFIPGKPIPFQLFLDGSILELFLDERLALAANLYGPASGGLAIMARDGKVSWDKVVAKGLKRQAPAVSQ